MARLNINPKFSHHLILQPAEENQDSPRMAYLKRQPVEKKLRRQIDMWHNTPFSSILTQKIQCQLEIDQDFLDWNDSTDITRSLNNSRCVSPVLSTHSARSDTINPMPCFPSAANTSSCRPSVSKNSHIVEQSQVVRHVPTHPQIVHKNKPKTNTLKSKSRMNSSNKCSFFQTSFLVSSHRQPPSDLSRQWRWTNKRILYDQFDHDEFYWIETESNKEKNVVAKIYMPKNDRTARIRAQCERVALERLTEFSCVPKLLNSNVNTSNDHQSNKELWTIMKLFNGETLSDYIKANKMDFREALYITRQLLNIIKQIHDRNVIHRDIQPKNILIEQRSNINEINLMLINFSSAWINNYQWTHYIEDCDERLGNQFYRMPQFENQSIDTEQNETNGQFRYSPTIDTTGICAILFWMITGHEPKESQDISGQPPHKLRDNLKIIEKKIIEMTGNQILL
jgi:tRNA A-37 threonylcarbamoyl transferase component Bud32